MGLPKWVDKEESSKSKSIKQEGKLAKRFNGRTTVCSGALAFDKADVVFNRGKTNLEPKSLRIECKRTDKSTLLLDKEWISKLRRDIKPKEFLAMELEIQDERVYLIAEGEFRFLKWILTSPVEEIISKLQGG